MHSNKSLWNYLNSSVIYELKKTVTTQLRKHQMQLALKIRTHKYKQEQIELSFA